MVISSCLSLQIIGCSSRCKVLVADRLMEVSEGLETRGLVLSNVIRELDVAMVLSAAPCDTTSRMSSSGY